MYNYKNKTLSSMQSKGSKKMLVFVIKMLNCVTKLIQ